MGSSTVATDTHPSALRPERVLFLNSPGDSTPMLDEIRGHGYAVKVADLAHVRHLLASERILLVDVTTWSFGFANAVRELVAAANSDAARVRVLCFSTVHRNPQFVLELERSGARYARVATSAMLLEALELALAELDEFNIVVPRFSIVHRYAKGSCAPGEEISAVFIANCWAPRQLRLPLTQRILFDFLAQHRRIAMDSHQISSGLAGSWFYRQHSLNSGTRQVARIRPATVKVLVQRIRDAMTSTFIVAGLTTDAYEVLRSIPAVGSRKVLYQLYADVDWQHFRD